MVKVNEWEPFTDAAQAGQHLANRFVVFEEDGLPKRMIYVSRLWHPEPHNPGREAAGALYNDVSGAGQNPIPLKHPGFNSFRFDPLGWINYDTGAILASVIPIRQTRRGYGEENVEMWEFCKNVPDIRQVSDDIDLQQLMYSDGMNEMLRNEYPTIANAAREVFGQPDVNVAVSRSLAIQSDKDGYTWLWRCAERVGMFADRETVRLSRRFDYLREELLETDMFNFDGVRLA